MKKEPFDIWGFQTHVEYYYKQLLKNPVGATPDQYLKDNGWGNPKLLDALCSKGVVTKIEKIKPDGNGKDQFCIQYKVNDNPGDKIKQLFNEKVKQNLNEDEGGMGGGATSAGFALGDGGANTNDGTFITPLGKKKGKKTDVISRPFNTMVISEKQAQMLMSKLLDEATSEGSVGDFAVDAPAFGDAETMNHNNIMASATKNWK